MARDHARPHAMEGLMPCSIFCVCTKCSQRIAGEHRAGDERLGRDWLGGHGCACSACRDLRTILNDIDASFKRLEELEKKRDLIRRIAGE